MIYTTEVQHMCPVAKGAYHGPAPIPEEGKWVQAKQLSDISGFTHGIGWCAPQQGACKLSLNVKYGYSIPDVSRNVQDKVASAIESMTGLSVLDVNIRIAGVVNAENE